MRSNKRVAPEKWLILGILLALVPFFQNMSSLQEEGVDIRQIAPIRPAGNWDSPLAQYVPANFRGNSLGDVQQQVLSHNFDPMLKDLELTYVPQSHGGRSPASLGPAQGALEEPSTSSWKLGLVNPTKLRLQYINPDFGQGLQMSCEAESGHSGVVFKVHHPLSQQLNVGFSHETGERQSQLQMDYRW